MRLSFRKAPEVEVEPPSFGPWVVRHFTDGTAIEALSAEDLLQVCADSAAIAIGAAYAYSGLLLAMFEPTAGSLEQSTVLAQLTQAGFEKIAAAATPIGSGSARAAPAHPIANLRADPGGVWPWEHLAVAIVNQQRDGRLDPSDEAVGRAILETATVYVLSHREQLTSVLDLWYRAVEQLPSEVVAGKQDLVRTGAYLLEQFHEEQGLADIFAEAKAEHGLPAAQATLA